MKRLAGFSAIASLNAARASSSARQIAGVRRVPFLDVEVQSSISFLKLN
jgi:hypothetical protein